MSTVLCIEDEAHLREIIVEELEDEGYNVLQAGDGREGLKMILRHSPDMVVSDITMPNMNGHELLVELRKKHPEYAEMPFVFLSALADKEQVMEGLELGADDYLSKPIDYDMLLVKVKSGLRQSCRVEEKHQKEQVKLFRALTAEDADGETSLPEMPPRQVALIGEGGKGLFDIQRLLEQLGHRLTVFTSGRSYLHKVKTNGFKAHLTLIWLQSDDMQGPMIIKTIQNTSGCYVMMVPENLGMNPQNMNVNGFDDIVSLPLGDDELIEKFCQWTGTEAIMSGWHSS